ncbi:MAG: peptidoglycan bridge formation glycyltransferase FemA/FemB family protein [Candidatus Paceibacterota bacterium]|jgi:lipid II:glycine glycyltransferase (peptidoglycan interpeptide bridge formation enzyme)
MEIREISNKEEWEKFILNESPDTFLQSWNWGEINRNTGDRIWRFGIYEDNILRSAFLVIRINAKRGSFLFIPHGPIENNLKMKIKNEKLWNTFFEYLKQLGKRERVDFIRISPILENNEQNLEIFKSAGFKDAPIHMMHPEMTWLLDISKNEDEIMKGMRKTHRNLIRRAEKEGVKIIQGTDEKYLKAFYDIHMETVRRHKFVPFSFDYIQKEVDLFKKDGQVSIFSAVYNEEIISSAIIVFYGNEAFYHHGASSSKYYKVPASYLVLWNAIKEAKGRGCTIFNFYGIVENKPKHPWTGLSNFKQGFGGYKKELVHCQDFVLRKKYIINYFVEHMRKLKRGY